MFKLKKATGSSNASDCYEKIKKTLMATATLENLISQHCTFHCDGDQPLTVELIKTKLGEAAVMVKRLTEQNKVGKAFL